MTDDTAVEQQSNPADTGAESESQGAAPQAESTETGGTAEGQGTEAASEAGKAKETEDKPDGESKETEADAEKKEGDEGDKPKAPEKYEAFQVPDGFTLEGERLEKFQTLAKSSNWSQEEAQGVLNDFVSTVSDDFQARHAKLVEGWGKELKEDPEFGGANFEPNLKTAASAVARFGGQPLIDVLNEFGLGNHPVVNKTFLKIGKAISEGGIPGTGSPTTGAPKSILERLYPGAQE